MGHILDFGKGFTSYVSYSDKSWRVFAVATVVASLPDCMPGPKTQKHFLIYVRSQIINMTGKWRSVCILHQHRWNL